MRKLQWTLIRDESTLYSQASEGINLYHLWPWILTCYLYSQRRHDHTVYLESSRNSVLELGESRVVRRCRSCSTFWTHHTGQHESSMSCSLYLQRRHDHTAYLESSSNSVVKLGESRVVRRCSSCTTFWAHHSARELNILWYTGALDLLLTKYIIVGIRCVV